MIKQVAVIGLGDFGSSIVEELISRGVEVLAIDRNPSTVEKISSIATRAVTIDALNEEALVDIGIRDVDTAVVCLGEDISSTILTTLILKEQGIKNIIVRARSELEGKVLSKIGASRIVYPEKEMGKKIAESIISSNVVECIQLSLKHKIVEIKVPKVFIGKTIRELNIRENYNVLIIGIKRKVSHVVKNGRIEESEEIIIPTADDKFIDGDKLILVGENKSVEKILKLRE